MTDESAPDPEEFKDPLCDYAPASFDSHLQRALAEEPVSAIQSQPFATVELGATVREAVDLLRRLQVGSLLVVDDEGRLVGIFTERDVLERVVERYASLAEAPVRDVMTSDPMIVYNHAPSATALAAIAVAGYRHVPVLDEADQLVGIVSPRRVFRFLESHFT